jgi:hypothetical protein
MYQLESQSAVISNHESYNEAVDAAYEYAGKDGVVGHAGDLADGGDRTLVWSTEDDSQNDHGVNAIASIRIVS